VRERVRGRAANPNSDTKVLGGETLVWVTRVALSATPEDTVNRDQAAPSWLEASGNGSLHLLWQDGERVFCSAWRDGDVGRIPCIAVLPAAEHPAASSVKRLVHEFALREFLDGTWALKPLELVRERGRTMLLLELPESKSFSAVPLDRFVSNDIALWRFLRLAIGVSAAVARMHRS